MHRRRSHVCMLSVAAEEGEGLWGGGRCRRSRRARVDEGGKRRGEDASSSVGRRAAPVPPDNPLCPPPPSLHSLPFFLIPGQNSQHAARGHVLHPTTSPTRHSPRTCTPSTSPRTTACGAKWRTSTGFVRNRARTGRCSPRMRARRLSPPRQSAQARGTGSARRRQTGMITEMKCEMVWPDGPGFDGGACYRAILGPPWAVGGFCSPSC